MIEEVSTPALIKTTASLAEKIWNHHYVPIIGQEQVDYMLDKFQSEQAITAQLDQGYHYFLVSYSSGPVGYAAVICKDQKLMLSKLYVSATERGLGLGVSLLAHCKDFAIQNNCEAIWLTVNRYNSNSIAWYQNKGFKIVQEKKFDIGNGYIMDDYILESSIKELRV